MDQKLKRLLPSQRKRKLDKRILYADSIMPHGKYKGQKVADVPWFAILWYNKHMTFNFSEKVIEDATKEWHDYCDQQAWIEAMCEDEIAQIFHQAVGAEVHRLGQDILF